MVGFIYKITNINTGKVYIGQTTQPPTKRCKGHFKALRRGVHHSQYLQRSFNKHGESAFEFEVIDVVSSDKLDEYEIYYIEYYNSFKDGYNMTMGGGGHLGVEMTESTKQKLRDANLGKKQSFEAIEKRRQKMIGHTTSEDTRKKLSDAHKGKIMTDEHKENLSKSHMGIQMGRKSKCKKPIICIEEDKFFWCLRDACDWLGKPINAGSHITSCIKGTRNIAYGYHWRYATQSEIESNI